MQAVQPLMPLLRVFTPVATLYHIALFFSQPVHPLESADDKVIPCSTHKRFRNHLLICPHSMVGAFIGSSVVFFTVMQMASTSTGERCPKVNGKVYSIEIALWVMLRDACVFALGVTNAQASWLAQVGCSDMIGRGRVSLKAQTCTARSLRKCPLPHE